MSIIIKNNTQDDDAWTKSYLIDRIKQQLITIEVSLTCTDDKKVYDDRKYYNQAHHFLKIGVLKPVPYFVVHLYDLTPRLKKELYELDDADRSYVLRQAIGRVFEDVNFGLYHNGISKALKVRLEN